LGLPKKDAEIYIYLAMRGPQEPGNIADKLKLSKQQLDSGLRSLQEKEIVIPQSKYSTYFMALSLEKTMALLMKTKKEEAQRLEQNKEEILNEWRSMTTRNLSSN
jgi:sugar-specific transcriptional regulator TrmB